MMSEEDNDRLISRRKFLEVGSAVIGATAVSAVSSQDIQKAGQDRSGSDPLKPDDETLSSQNPDSVTPPPTDHGNVKPFKYPFTFSHRLTQEGGWARQVNIDDLPVSTTIAGVDMRLTTGGIRELHWHTAGEWSFMLYGNARITCLDQNGKPFVDDVKEGDLWFFPTGYPHSIQGLEPDGCEFLLVFDDGAFSEYDTVLLTDWMAHTPRSVLVKNLNVSQQELSKIPDHALYVFQAELPKTTLAEDRQAAAGDIGLSSQNFSFRMLGAADASNKIGRSAHCRFQYFPSIQIDRGGACHCPPRGNARTTLAPEC